MIRINLAKSQVLRWALYFDHFLRRMPERERDSVLSILFFEYVWKKRQN